MVGPGEPPPGGLDLGRGGARPRRRGRRAGRVSPSRQCNGDVLPPPRLTGRRSVPSPSRMGTVRRAGLAGGRRRRAARAGLSVRARVPGPRRLPAPRPAARHARRPRPALRDDDGRDRRASTCRPGSSRPATARPARAWSSSTAGSRPATGRCRWRVFLHAAGFHCLTFDVRGHGANPPETLPISAGEFGLDALAALRRAAGPARGHGRRRSSGTRWAAIGAILAAAADPRVAALVATSAPADPYRLTRQTFRLAHLPIPDPIAYPARLADHARLPPAARPSWSRDVSASDAIARYRGPILLAHGDAGRGRAAGAHGATGRGRAGGRPRTLASRTGRAGRDPARARRASTPGCTSSRPTAGRWRAFAGRGARRTARPRRSRRASPPRRTPSGSPTRESSLRRDRGRRPAASGRSPRSPCPGATRPRPSRRSPARRRARDRLTATDDPVWDAIRSQARHPRASPTGRSSRRTSSGSSTRAVAPAARKNSQRWAFIVCRDREHLRELSDVGPYAGHLAGAAVGDRARDAGPDARPDAPLSILFDLGQAAENMMLAAWELGIGSVPGDRLRARPRAATCSATRPTSAASTCSRSATRPIPTDLTRPPKAGGRGAAATSWSTRSAGRADRAGGPYCQRNLRDAIPKQTTSQPTSTAAHTHSGANGAPPTMTWRSASAR